MDELQAIIEQLKTGTTTLADAKDTKWLAMALGMFTGEAEDANVLMRYLQKNR
jgi:hypothetical protein